MSAEMRKCKECGKLFIPKNARVQYCSDLHYRPCPVCGKPVEAKYLSDPARVCSGECRKQLAEMRKNGIAPPYEGVKFTVNEASNSVDLNNIPEEPKVLPTDKSTHENDGITKAEEANSTNIEPSLNEDNSNIDNEYEEQIRNGSIVATYLGRSVLGFEQGHKYALQIKPPAGHGSYAYEVSAVYDFTEHTTVDTMMPLSSQSSIDQRFRQEA